MPPVPFCAEPSCLCDGTHGLSTSSERYCEWCLKKMLRESRDNSLTNTFAETECGIIHFVFKDGALFAAHTYIDYRR